MNLRFGNQKLEIQALMTYRGKELWSCASHQTCVSGTTSMRQSSRKSSSRPLPTTCRGGGLWVVVSAGARAPRTKPLASTWGSGRSTTSAPNPLGGHEAVPLPERLRGRSCTKVLLSVSERIGIAAISRPVEITNTPPNALRHAIHRPGDDASVPDSCNGDVQIHTNPGD